MTVPVLAAENLSVEYRIGREWRSVLSDISLSLGAGEIHGLVGESGSGKTTLGMTLMRYLDANARITAGRVLLDGDDLVLKTTAELRDIWGRLLNLVPQNPLAALNPSYPIGDQIGEVTRRHASLTPRKAWEQAVSMLRKVKIADPDVIARRYPHQLSGGMRQRVSIAMALSTQPRLLVLDEPTTALDVTTQAVILDLFRELIHENHAAALYISHDLATIAQLCERVTVLYAGEVMETAPVRALYARPLHPYTQGLLASLPHNLIEGSETRLPVIPGVAPSLAERPPACVFAPRCPLALALCHAEKPPLEETPDGRTVRCHRWQEVEGGLQAFGGQLPADSGQRTADSYQQTADSGQQPADSGQQPADSGQRTAISGQLPADSGQLPADSGQLLADSGQQPADSGQQPATSGQLPADSGQPPADSGQLPADSGQRTADSGQRPADSYQRTATSGQLPADSGQLPADCGQQPAISGQLPADSGQPPADSGQLPADSHQGTATSGQLPADSGQQPATRGQQPVNGGKQGADGAQTTVLRARGVTKHFGEGGFFARLTGMVRPPVQAVDDVSLHVNAKSTLGLVGESGSGKTTLARLIVGLEPADRGELQLMGVDLPTDVADRPQAALRQLQMVMQNPNEALNPYQTVGQAISRPLRRLEQHLTEAQIKARVAALLESVRLPLGHAERVPSELSGGEKQRVAIARAFAANPALIVADEPTSALDVSVQAVVLNLLKDLRAAHGSSYLLISHDLDVVAYLAEWICVMYLGQIVEQGKAAHVYGAPSHPYTEALVSAVPVADPDAPRKGIRLDGEVPSARSIPTGCRFHTRCPRCLGDICINVEPPMRDAGDGHLIRCHIPLDELARLQAAQFALQPAASSRDEGTAP